MEKIRLTPQELCVDRAECLLPLFEYSYGLQFNEQPDYGRLKHLLTKILLDRNQVPDLNFDWTF